MHAFSKILKLNIKLKYQAWSRTRENECLQSLNDEIYPLFSEYVDLAPAVRYVYSTLPPLGLLVLTSARRCFRPCESVSTLGSLALILPLNLHPRCMTTICLLFFCFFELVEVLKVYSYCIPQGSCLGAYCLRPWLTPVL